MANNTYRNTSNGGPNWNALLNALPKSERKYFKCTQIAGPERQKVGTNSYRHLNVFANTVSPTPGRPWTSGAIPRNTIINANLTILDVTSPAAGNFTVIHGVRSPITAVYIQQTSASEIWLQTPISYDSANVYLVASSPNATAILTFLS